MAATYPEIMREACRRLSCRHCGQRGRIELAFVVEDGQDEDLDVPLFICMRCGVLLAIRAESQACAELDAEDLRVCRTHPGWDGVLAKQRAIRMQATSLAPLLGRRFDLQLPPRAPEAHEVEEPPAVGTRLRRDAAAGLYLFYLAAGCAVWALLFFGLGRVWR